MKKTMDTRLLTLAAETIRVHINEMNANPERVDTGAGWDDAARDWLGGPVGEFCALMSPNVAKAMIELLTVMSWMPSNADPTDLAVAMKLARAILREDYL